MRTLIFGLLAYIVLTGCGLLAGRLLKLRLTEGMIFAVALIDLILYVTGLGGRFSIGIGILCGLGLAGFCLALAGDLTAAKSGRRNRRLTLMQEFLSPYYVMLTIIFLGSMVLYYGDFIWHIDEFHLYALSPKYMLETGKLPLAVDYIAGAKDVLAGSLFHLFFQKFTGYNEGMMYVSSTLLTWIGLLLPFAFTFGPAGWHFHRQGRERGEGAGGSVKAQGEGAGGSVKVQGEGAGTAVKAGETGIRYRKGAWSGIILYTLILYIGIYSLYGYGIKNLYVDLPTLAWAAGLAGWWMASSDSFVSRFARVRSSRSRASGNRAGEGGSPERKRGISFETSEILLVLLVLIMVTLFKPHIGLLLAVLAALFLLTEEIRRYLISRETQRRARAGRPRWKTVLLAFAALLVLAVLAVLAYAWNIGRTPEGMINFLGNAGASLREKAKPVTIAFVTAIVGNSLSSNSELKLTLPTMSVLVLAIFMVGADLKNDRKRGLVYVIYSVAAEILYLGALFAAFLFIFSYEESIKVAGIGRYMTCIILFLLIIALVWLLAIPVREMAAGAEDVSVGAAAPGRSAPEGIARTAAAGRICGYVGLVLLVFFSLGLDRDYVPNHTSLNKPKAVGYEDIKRTREQAKEIKAVLKDGERVYILNQSNTNEFPTNGALYYLGDAVNNYLREPWKFTEIGNVTRLREGDEITIRDFPDILKSGGYNYVWVYTSNGYLKEALPEVMEVTWDVGEPEEETEAESEAKAAGEAAEGKEADAASAASAALTDEPESETEPVTEPVLANNRLYKVEVDDDGSVKLVGDRELWR